MMRRTIVSIEQDATGGLTAKLVKAEFDIPDARRPTPLACDPAALPPLDSAANVQAYGQRLRECLVQHPAIQVALQNLAQTPAGQRRTLCFEILATPGEQIRWEALCDDKGGFVALNGRCQLGRIADEISNHDTGVRLFTPPLRVAAFLSAAGIRAEPEWAALSDAMQRARADGLQIEMRTFVGEQQLLDAAGTAVAAGTHPGVTVEPIPASAIGLGQKLDEWRPHVVHFFCHGSTAFGVPYIELSTVLDHDNDEASGSVILEIDRLVEVGGVRDAWLVVLNCCLGGQASERLSSMAHRLVAAGGVPAAIGMQEPVEVADANAFCANLYPPVFRVLRDALNAAGAKPVPVDLTGAVGLPRQALRDMHATSPAAFGRWTLPVLYVHREPLQVHRMHGAAPGDVQWMRERVDLVANMLRQLPPDTPGELRAKLLATLDTPPAVPLAMRPNLDGRFPMEA